MTADQEKEILNDVQEFITLAKNNPQKSFTLRLEAGKGEFRGGALEINKQGGKGVRFA